MKRLIAMGFAVSMAAGCAMFGFGPSAKTVDLRVDHMPRQMNAERPVFSWRMAAKGDESQTAYRIVVFKGVTPKVRKQVWDSGEIEGGESVGIEYAGPELESLSRYSWQVHVRDSDGDWLDPAEGRFATGASPKFWTDGYGKDSKWIRPDAEMPEPEKKREMSAPVTGRFMKTVVNPAAVRRAFWCVTGLGAFDVYVNGELAGDEFLKPGFTHVKKCRRSYNIDVTSKMKTGKGEKNVLAAEVSAGWWRDKIVNYSGHDCAFRAVLKVAYMDGTEKFFGTDETWLAQFGGPVKNASIFEGEDYDANLEDRAFATGVDKRFAPAKESVEFKGEIRPMVGSPIRLREDLALLPVEAYVWKDVENADPSNKVFGTVKKVREYKDGGPMTLKPGEKLVVDFGQNAAAVPEFEFSAAKGVRLEFLNAEMLNDGNGERSRGNDGPSGSIYRENMRGARTSASYVFAGRAGGERFLPRHTFFGYRYATITASGDVRITKLRSIPVTSIARGSETGRIVTGVPELNKLVSNILWGQYSNYLSVPTDCPQRNERLGWTADTQVFTRAASYNAEVYGFLAKWMDDMVDSQDEDGGFPSVAPFAQYGNEKFNFGWADAGIIVPWTIWTQFGDTTVITRNWDAMVKFVKKLDETKYKYDDKHYTYADWLSYEKFETCGNKFGNWGKWKDDKDARNYREFLAACYWLYDSFLMAEMADAIGNKADAAYFRGSARRAHDYIRATYVEEDGLLLKPMRDIQTACIFALKFGIVNGEAVAATIDILKKSIKDHGDCLQTGFLGTSFIMDTLTYQADAPDVAYTLLLQHKNPSWLYSVDQGATTIWERWNSYTKADGFGPVGMNSFNHYAYGAVAAWMYGTMAGIKADEPGFKTFTLAPLPDPRVGFVNVVYDSPYGPISSSWKYDDSGRCRWNFTVPPNTTAKVKLPCGDERICKPGSYKMEIK